MNKLLIYQSPDGKTKLDVTLEDETLWLNQKQLCELFGKSKSTISEHIKVTFEDEELDKDSVVRNYRTTASDGKNYNVEYYNLDMIIAIGFKVRSRSGVQFRKWANSILKEYIVKGFAMDDKRLKNPPVAGSTIPDYFDELIERIRDIRASERRMYLRVREIFALASDYDPSWSETTRFFQHIQNKLHFAVTHMTAAELIVLQFPTIFKNIQYTSQKNIPFTVDIFAIVRYTKHRASKSQELLRSESIVSAM